MKMIFGSYGPWALLITALSTRPVFAEEEPLEARAYDPRVHDKIASFESVPQSTEVEGEMEISVTEDSPTEKEIEMARLCTDDVNLQYMHLDRKVGQVVLKDCSWVGEKPMVRCNFELNSGMKLKDSCPFTCGLCPTRKQIIPCPEPEISPQPSLSPTIVGTSTDPTFAPTPATTIATTATETFTTTEGTTFSGTLTSTASVNAVVTGSQASEVNKNDQKTMAVLLSVIPLVLLLFLIWLYCCCCRKGNRDGKYYDDEEDDTDEDEEAYPIHKVKSAETRGSGLIGLVVSAFNGRRNDPKTDVHRCNSAYCDAHCAEGDDVNHVMSMESYEKRKEETEC